MSLYLLLNRIKVENANTIAGFTWGFPAITHFLGFTHNLARKHACSSFADLKLEGCGVVAHERHVHTYGNYNDRFLQSKNPAYLKKDAEEVAKGSSPSIIEEGKMNMTVSLLIAVEGVPGRRTNVWLEWVKSQCLRQRLAGGSIWKIGAVALFDLSDSNDFYRLKRQLLPGFALMDRSEALAEHYQKCLEENPETEQIDAWLDFVAFKQRARPQSNLISAYLKDRAKAGKDIKGLYECWNKHLETPYEGKIPDLLKAFFSDLPASKEHKQLLQQWAQYMVPDAKTLADWTYQAKPAGGYLVPIMTGYKAISQVYDNHEIMNTRDAETPVCFVESVHSVGEWQGVHRFREVGDIIVSLWHYQFEDGWYLCRQTTQEAIASTGNLDDQILAMYDNPEDELV